MENKYDLSWEEIVFEINNSFSREIRDFAYNSYITLDINDNCKRFHESLEFKRTLEIVKKYSPDTHNILDFYAGGGIASFAFAKEGYLVTAYEKNISRIVGTKAIEQVKNNLNINIIAAKNDSINISDNYFDIIYSRGILHNQSDMDKSLMELNRVLKPGGIILVLRENVIDNYEGALKKFYATDLIHSIYGKGHAHTLSRYKKSLKENSFEILETIKPYKSEINLMEKSFESFSEKILNSPKGKIFRNLLGKKIAVTLGLFFLKN